MRKIVNIDDLSAVRKKVNDKKLVLVGGAFDIVHIGHISFLRNAKKEGDILIVLLESDESLKKSKGESRPINTQIDRAELLSELASVDYVVLLKKEMSNEDYDAIVKLLKPAIIATTKGDPNIHHKERQANLIGAKVEEVILPVADKSTSRIAKLLSKEL